MPAGYTGKSVKLLDAPNFLTGQGNFIEDMNFPNQLCMAILLSPYPHAKISGVRLNVPEDRFPFVTGKEVADRTLPLQSPVTANISHYCLAVDKVRYVGEGVAAVACDSRYEARDVLDSFEVDYEPAKTIVDAEEAMSPEVPRLHEPHGSNIGWHRTLEYGNVTEAFRKADIVLEEKIRWARSALTPIETYGCIAQFDKVSGHLTVWGNFQTYGVAVGISDALRIPREKLKLVTPKKGRAYR